MTRDEMINRLIDDDIETILGSRLITDSLDSASLYEASPVRSVLSLFFKYGVKLLLFISYNL
jgi:hypothetical protein